MSQPGGKKKKIKMEFSAGGVVFQRTPLGPLIAFVLDPYHKWTFAKGKIERGEKMAHAARRETEEEMGMRGLKVLAPLGKTDIWFYGRYQHGKPVPRPWALVHKFIYYFLMEAPRGARTTPQRAELIRAVRWVSLRDARKTLSYRNVAQILERAIQLIQSGKMVQ